MSALTRLTVIYDPGCGFCSRVRSILETEPAYLAMEFLPYGGPAVMARYPGLCTGRAPELFVVDDAGGVYEETAGYLMCLYATVSYRPLALRLSSPLLLPFARQAFALIGRNRKVLSQLLGLSSDQDLAHSLSAHQAPYCQL